VNNTDKNIFSTQARVRLVELGSNQVRLAEELGVTREAINRAIHTLRLPALRKRIAQQLGIELSA